MKKVVIGAVAVALFYAGPALAVVATNGHNMTKYQTVETNTETCVYCHTPHSAGTQAPLWNRADLGTRVVNGVGVLTNPESGVCLSCHDGSAIGALINPSVGTVFTGSITGAGNLGDMNNDHPVSVQVPANANWVLAAQGTWAECTSCHNPHDETNAPFLKASNANSAICVGCHAK